MSQSPTDDIVAGLVDSQILSCERVGDKLVLLVDPPDIRGLWQAKLVGWVAADIDDSLDSFQVDVLDEGERRIDSRTALVRKASGAFDVASENEIRAALGDVTFHRPQGRVAIERRLVVDDPQDAKHHTDDRRLIGEGFYTEWYDADGELIRAWGYVCRAYGGIGMWGRRYEHLTPRRTIG